MFYKVKSKAIVVSPRINSSRIINANDLPGGNFLISSAAGGGGGGVGGGGSGKIEKLLVSKPPSGHKLFDPKSNFSNVVKIDKKFGTTTTTTTKSTDTTNHLTARRSNSRGGGSRISASGGGHDSDTGVVLLLSRENSTNLGIGTTSCSTSPRKSSLDGTLLTTSTAWRTQQEREEANMNKLKSLLNRRLSLNSDRRFGKQQANNAQANDLIKLTLINNNNGLKSMF